MAEKMIPSQNEREQWVGMITKIADPVLHALAADKLKATMVVEARNASTAVARKQFTYLEAFGRLLCGMAPWVDLTGGKSQEADTRARYLGLVKQSLENAVNPSAKDFMNFNQGSQPLVDASFLALGLLRGPKIWEQADDGTKKNIIAAMKSTRVIKPGFNNWLLFSGLIEAFFLHIGEPYDKMRIDYALRQHEQWYKGDGMFGDGPEFHWDFYNSFVIQPYMRTILDIVSKTDLQYNSLHEKFNKIAARYAVILERLIAEDGSYPAIGRSIAYRCGAFHHLANEASLKLLPKELAPGQVRSALTAVISKTLGQQASFDGNGWLRPGLSGSQPDLAEEYISTGSLYLCAAAFLPLGLRPENEFWTAPLTPWTAKKIWNGRDMAADAALKL